MRERERGIESLSKRVLEYSWEKWNGLYHWTIGTFLMDHSCVLVNGAMDYSQKRQWTIVMDHSLFKLREACPGRCAGGR